LRRRCWRITRVRQPLGTGGPRNKKHCGDKNKRMRKHIWQRASASRSEAAGYQDITRSFFCAERPIRHLPGHLLTRRAEFHRVQLPPIARGSIGFSFPACPKDLHLGNEAGFQLCRKSDILLMESAQLCGETSPSFEREDIHAANIATDADLYTL
jgi:hypothetical protein